MMMSSDILLERLFSHFAVCISTVTGLLLDRRERSLNETGQELPGKGNDIHGLVCI